MRLVEPTVRRGPCWWRLQHADAHFGVQAEAIDLNVKRDVRFGRPLQ